MHSYVGDFILGEFSGQGKLAFNACLCVHMLCFVHDLRVFVRSTKLWLLFTGKLTMPSGESYVGGWLDNRRSGAGELIKSNGDRYTGSFKNHRFHGRGSFTDATNCSTYNGASTWC